MAGQNVNLLIGVTGKHARFQLSTSSLGYGVAACVCFPDRPVELIYSARAMPIKPFLCVHRGAQFYD